MPSPSADARVYPRAVTLAAGGTVSLRLMAPDDGDRLVAFARELPPDDLLFLSVDITDPEAVGRFIEGLDAGRIVGVIAEDAGVTAGYAALLHHGVTWQRHLGEIFIQVSSRHRSRGLGRALATEISAIARDLGLRKFIARMTPDQKGAVSTFERLGFKTEALLQDFVIDADGRTRDILVMARDAPAAAP
jgi:L-amino acid N-acyltransferase YncA